MLHLAVSNPGYWLSPVPEYDDFGDRIVSVFIDGKTVYGPWALMTPLSWRDHGVRRLGTGFGQKYSHQPDGRWLKVEG